MRWPNEAGTTACPSDLASLFGKSTHIAGRSHWSGVPVPQIRRALGRAAHQACSAVAELGVDTSRRWWCTISSAARVSWSLVAYM